MSYNSAEDFFSQYESDVPAIPEVKSKSTKGITLGQPEIGKKKDANSAADFFSQYDEPVPEPEGEEGWLSSAFRTGVQPLLGIAGTTGPGLIAGFGELFSHGELGTIDEEEVDRWKGLAKQYGLEFDEDAYRKAHEAAHESGKYYPTVSNISRMTEEQTGLPLVPKTKLQKGVRFLSEATNLAPKTGTLRLVEQAIPATFGKALPKLVQGAGVEATSEILQGFGLPEPVAQLLAFGALKMPEKTAEGVSSAFATPSIERVKKPSGMPSRRYEKLTEPREVSTGKAEKIAAQVEKDFKKISDEILETALVSKTRKEIADNPAFKKEVGEQFQKVEELAEAMPETFNTQQVKKAIVDEMVAEKGTGFAASEYEKEYRNLVKTFLKETPDAELNAANLVQQYRKNNKALGEYFEPGSSKAMNRAKKDALLAYNRAISKVINEKYPESEFANLFKETNKKWAEINDAEAIDGFINDLFDGSMNYKSAKKFLENENMARPFKRGLGPDNYKRFEGLVTDMLKTEKPFKMIKVAKDKGWNELAKTASSYMLHPHIAVLKVGVNTIKSTWKSAVDLLLDKPQITITWKKAIDSLKKGDFKTASKEFENLDNKVQAFSRTNAEVIDTAKAPKADRAPKSETIEVKAEKIDPKMNKADDLKAEPKLLDNKSKKEVKPIAKEKTETPKSKPKKQKAPNKTPTRAENVLEKDWIYTKEDFPTKKEAEEYLDHLHANYRKKPTERTEKDIRNLEDIIDSFKKD